MRLLDLGENRGEIIYGFHRVHVKIQLLRNVLAVNQHRLQRERLEGRNGIEVSIPAGGIEPTLFHQCLCLRCVLVNQVRDVVAHITRDIIAEIAQCVEQIYLPVLNRQADLLLIVRNGHRHQMHLHTDFAAGDLVDRLLDRGCIVRHIVECDKRIRDLRDFSVRRCLALSRLPGCCGGCRRRRGTSLIRGTGRTARCKGKCHRPCQYNANKPFLHRCLPDSAADCLLLS